MTRPVTTERVEAGLAQRLAAVRPYLVTSSSTEALPSAGTETQPGDLLDALVAAVMEEPTPARVWLLSTAVSGAFPTADDVRTATRFFRIAPRLEATMWILDYAVTVANDQVADKPVQVVAGGVVVDVDHTARHDLHTGIQQVVRQVLPEWSARHHIVPVAWTEPALSMRALTSPERDRVLRWGKEAPSQDSDSEEGTLVVPWRSVVVLPEVPLPDACDRLAALAQFSGNAVVAIGYDCIPILSADMVPVFESNRFARYLTVVKHARRMACIGATPNTEFSGFVSALPAQGLSGPEVVEVPLPVEALREEPKGRTNGGTALVLGVGTFEPRKNQAAVLHACERLWRQGLRFELLLIGGAGWIDSVPETVHRLQQAGRAVRLVEKATASELRAAYRQARFTVFPSLHEGFGLPIAESFEQGTPVLTTRFGSTGEVAGGGGALLVDPYDDEELVEAMRLLLTDDEVLSRLRREILERPVRSWSQYAADVWDALVAPELQGVTSEPRPPW